MACLTSAFEALISGVASELRGLSLVGTEGLSLRLYWEKMDDGLVPGAW